MTSETEQLTEAQFCGKMVTKYRELLLKCAGLTSITIDGQTTSLAQLETQYDFWTRKLARLNKTRPTVVTIDLRNS